MFDRIARRYDVMNTLISLGLDGRWRRQAAARLAPRQGGRYLDVGCGTGDMALEVLRQAPGAEVIGLDPAQQMLALARAKVRAAALAGSISFQVGDGTALAFSDGTFAGVISAFCIRNVTHRERALSEMHRVLAPNGHVVLLELTAPTGSLLRLGHRLYNRWLVPLAGRLATDGKAYQYLVDSIEDFPEAQEVESMLTEAGFVRSSHTPLCAGAVTVFVGERDVD